MALTKEDLQAIADLMDSKVQASETRMCNKSCKCSCGEYCSTQC